MGPSILASTGHSELLSYIALIVCTVISIPVCILVWIRRHYYPLNGIPTYLSILSIIGCPIGIIGFTGNYIVELPACGTKKIKVISGYFPGTTSVGVQIIYVYLSYRLQVERSLPRESRTLSARLVSNSYLIFYHILLVLAFAAPNLLTTYILMREDPITGDCIPNDNPGQQTALMIVAMATKVGMLIFFFRLAMLLKSAHEAFNFKNSVRKTALFTVFVCLPFAALQGIAPGIKSLSDEAQRQIQFVSYYAWCVLYFAHIYWGGITPLRLSYTHELHRRSIMANREQKASSTQYVHSTSELRKVLYESEDICQRFKNYLVKEFCVENMLFIIDMKHFRQRLDIGDQEEALSLLGQLREKYLRETSETEVNIGMELKGRVVRAIDRATKSKTCESADTALREAEQEVLQMIVDAFNRYLATSDSKTGSLASSTASVKSYSAKRIFPKSEGPS